MALSFVAIDFETANSFRGSPCAVGLARVRDGAVVATARWLIGPPAAYDHFDGFNMMLHGITPEMVEHEPRFAARLPEILAFVGDLPVVAHNAGFDVGVIRDACDASGLPWPDLRYACSLVLARQTYDLLSYSLPWVAEAAGSPLDHHHDPAADAAACAAIVLDLARRREAASLPDLVTASRCFLGHVGGDSWEGCHGTCRARASCLRRTRRPTRHTHSTGARWRSREPSPRCRGRRRGRRLPSAGRSRPRM